jgi:RNA polymerase sigma-70 factor, ECF subfamily
MAGRRNLDEISIKAVGIPETLGIPETSGIPADEMLGRLGADDDADSDRELLRRHVDGDSEAFGWLFQRHKDRLWAVALRTACDPEDAADALQEAMVSAFRRAADFRGDSAVTTWLHRIVVNAAVDRIRRRSARTLSWSGEEEMLGVLATGGLAAEGLALSGLAPAPDAVDYAEIRLDVTAALSRLPDQQRMALILVDMMGYPVAEVSEMLGVSVGTIKSRCARGRARLLPYVSHLRTNSAIGGNRADPVSVSSEQEGGA